MHDSMWPVKSPSTQRIVGEQRESGDAYCTKTERELTFAIQRRDHAAANAVESIGDFDSLVGGTTAEARSLRWDAAAAWTCVHGRDDRERRVLSAGVCAAKNRREG